MVQHGPSAGAYSQATLAAGRGWELGFDAWEADLASRQTVCNEVVAVVDQLGTFSPELVSDASGVIAAYSSVIDAIGLCDLAEDRLTRPVDTEEEFVTDLLVAAVYFEFADTLILGAEDQQGFSRGLGGKDLDEDVDTVATADFFRRTAEANLAAFDSLIIDEIASSEGVSPDIAKAFFSESFLEYALSVGGINVLHAIEEYFGDAEAASWARLGGSLEVYALTSSLLAQFYSLGAQIDDAFQIVGVDHERALLAALDLGEDQLAGTIIVLRDEDVEAPSVVGGYEAARLDRQGDTAEQFNALTRLWAGYVGGRMLSYLGGFETAGLG